MIQETLPGITGDRVYRNDREAWELHEAFYSRPEYAWPLVDYLRKACIGATGTAAYSIYRSFTGRVVEPCVGGGALVEGLRKYAFSDAAFAVGDIRHVDGAQWCADWAEPELDGFVASLVARADLVATNPPFSHAMAIVEASWRNCPQATVAILQRSSWYEPTKEHPRGAWLRAHNPDQVTIGRCKFALPDGASCGDGDSCSYTWFIWGPDRQGPLGGKHWIMPWWEAP